MRSLFLCCIGWVIFLCHSLTPSFAADGKFVPLFNGKDLSGWVNVDCAPSTWSVRDGMIFCTGVPTGVLRTTRHYENFILELEWKHMRKGGNSGLFIHSAPVTARGQPFTKAIEVQVLDGDDPKGMWTGHGDIFGIHGATMVPDRPHPGGWMRCLPSERRSHPAGEWNHYRVESRDGRLTLAVNGKIVSGATKCNPRKGYICLESEGGEIYFRNLRILELPSSHPPENEVAEMNQDFVSLYTGVDLSGWKEEPGHRGHWTPKDWILDYDGKSEAADKNLWSERTFGDFILIADWRFTAKPVTKNFPMILPDGGYATNADGPRKMVEALDAGDSGIYLRGSTNAEVNIWNWPIGSGEVYHYRVNAALSPTVRAAVTPRAKADAPLGEWNRFVITMRGDRLSVELNGKLVIENAQLPGIPKRGPIGLQHHGFPIQFANLYIKELN